MFSACLRAKDLYCGGGDGWAGMVRRAMQCDNGLAATAEKYMCKYERAATLS
jgi:glycogen synthase